MNRGHEVYVYGDGGFDVGGAPSLYLKYIPPYTLVHSLLLYTFLFLIFSSSTLFSLNILAVLVVSIVLIALAAPSLYLTHTHLYTPCSSSISFLHSFLYSIFIYSLRSYHLIVSIILIALIALSAF